MAQLLVLLTFIVFLVSIFNYLTMHQPTEDSGITEFISVIVPLRNEAHNIAELVKTLGSQSSLEHVEYILLNDNSEDKTFELLESAVVGLHNFRILQGEPLPKDWIGKTWALQQLLAAAKGELIVSLDADVRLKPDAISKSITLMKSQALDFLSPYPHQIALTLGERLIQPLLQWSWMSTIILRIAQRSSFVSMAVANGQFFLVNKKSLITAGGYEYVKNAVLDDVFLARRLLKTGSHGGVVSGAEIAECRMYSSWSEITAGYGKSLRHAFGSILGTTIAVLFIFITGIAPLILIFTGSMWGWIGLALIVSTRALSAQRSGMRIFDSLLHPLSSALLIYLIFYSYLKRGAIQWKGRTV